jgi:photosystem II stability/assembly factor-like uncharacterized protein
MHKKSKFLLSLLSILPFLFSSLLNAAPTPAACIAAGPIGISPSPTTVPMPSSSTATVTYTFTNLTNNASFQLAQLTPTITTISGTINLISASVINGCTQPIGPAPLNKTCTQTVTLTSSQTLRSTNATLNVLVCDTHIPKPIFCSTTSAACNQVNINVTPAPPTIYVGTLSGNVYFSTNNGVSWTNTANQPPGAISVTGVFKTSDALYAAAITDVLPTTTGDVFRTTDNGTSWTPLNLPADAPSAIFIKPETGSNYTIYAPTESFSSGISGFEVYSSSTATWTPRTSPEPTYTENGVFYTVYAGVPTLFTTIQNGNVQFSTDDGASWTATTQPDGSSVGGIFVTPGGTIYVSTFNGNVMLSNDKGASWTATATQPDPGSSVAGIFVTSTGTIYVATDSGNVAISSDGGASWQLATQPEPGASLTSISLG